MGNRTRLSTFPAKMAALGLNTVSETDGGKSDNRGCNTEVNKVLTKPELNQDSFDEFYFGPVKFELTVFTIN